MNIDVVTTADLEEFRQSLLNDLKEILSSKPATEPTWLKSVDVRKLLKVSPGTLQNLRISGRLQYSKIGGTFYYRSSDIEKLLQKEEKSKCNQTKR